jgi:apolipoprotein N-acyltransferase
MHLAESIRRFSPWIGAALTGLLLFASFPPFEWAVSAWVALVPLMLAVRDVRPRRALALGLLGGAVFWIPSISWLRHVSAPGAVGLALYCALYVMGFALIVSIGCRWLGVERWWKNMGLVLTFAAAWVALEYFRSIFATGFAWNSLGATQYRNVYLIQAARWGGVYAVSAVVVAVNAAIALTLLQYIDQDGRWKRPHPELMLAVLVLAAMMLDGKHHLRLPAPPSQPLRVALIQPNIPQPYFFMPEKFSFIRDTLRQLSNDSMAGGKPDLLIWSETADPEELRSSSEAYSLAYELVTNGVPLLAGSIDTEWTDEGPLYYNCTFLVDASGKIVQGYDKRHLVIFGEYVPLEHLFPFLKAVTPIEGGFTPGSTSTVFRLDKPSVAFSVLICFEDTVASLSRESVRNGARLLINETNDGWFEPSWASKQHMILCVFRSVENNVPVIRCANTGVSCVIDRSGRVMAMLTDENGCPRVVGFKTASVDVPDETLPPTFYTRHGDVFALSCTGLLWSALILPLVRKRKLHQEL